jgi:hypothetical protein
MTSPAEGAPQSVEVVHSPANLSGLTILEPGAAVELSNPGFEVPETAPTQGGNDSLTILAGDYQGRRETGEPFKYHFDARTNATRIIDVSDQDIVVEQDGQMPVKPAYATLSWRTDDPDMQPEPVLRPLLPGNEYDVLDAETGLPLATYGVSEGGTLTVTRTTELATDADVRLVGASANTHDYRPRPATEPVTATGFVTRTTAGVYSAPIARESSEHLLVDPGSWEAPAGDQIGAPTVKVTLGRALLFANGANGVHELRTAHTLAARQQEVDEGPATVDQFTTIGKDEQHHQPGRTRNHGPMHGNGPDSR